MKITGVKESPNSTRYAAKTCKYRAYIIGREYYSGDEHAVDRQ